MLQTDIQFAQPSPLLLQLASLSFILCGIHNDLFVIRFYVTLSYALLIANILLSAHQLLQWDSLLWSALGLFINGTSLISLALDERPVHLTEDQAALWRLLYRSGGFSARLFSSLVAPHLQVKEIQAGEQIPTKDCFYIVYTGQVRLRVHGGNNVVSLERIVQSGQMFDLRFLELFNDYSDHFFREGDIDCTTLTACKLFCFKREDIRNIAHHPLAKGVWQSLLINDLSITAERFASQQLKAHEYDSIFDPLEEWENPTTILPGSGVALRRPILHFITSLYRSLLLPWPFGSHQAGIRQTLLPPPRQKPKEDDSHRPFYRRLAQLPGRRRRAAGEPSTSSTQWTLQLRPHSKGQGSPETAKHENVGIRSIDIAGGETDTASNFPCDRV